MSLVEVLPEDELWIGELRGVSVNGRRVLLLRTEQGIRAYEDRCPHLGVPLSLGTLQGSTLTCSAHHHEFDAETGRGKNPKHAQLSCIRVACQHGQIAVEAAAAPELG